MTARAYAFWPARSTAEVVAAAGGDPKEACVRAFRAGWDIAFDRVICLADVPPGGAGSPIVIAWKAGRDARRALAAKPAAAP